VRISGTGNLSLELFDDARVEIMDGSVITLNSYYASPESYGMLINANATVDVQNDLVLYSRLVNCGELVAPRCKVETSGTLINNGMSYFTNPGSSLIVMGELENYGMLKSVGAVMINPNSSFENYCEVIAASDMYIQSHVHNYSSIAVGGGTKVFPDNNVMMYNSAMFETVDLFLIGRFIGNDETSLVKVHETSVITFTGCLEQTIAFCDLNGIEQNYNDNAFIDGAVEDCEIEIEESRCNSDGHEPTSKDNDDEEGTQASIIDMLDGVVLEHPGAELTENSITVWPNPTPGIGNVNFVSVREGDLEIHVYSTNGALVYTLFDGKVDKHQPISLEFDLGKFDQGVYMLKVMDNQSVINKRIVLTK